MDPVVLDLPFRGIWRAEMSPARRVPSHGTDLFGVTYAIDFVGVDERERSAPGNWRAWLSVEQPQTFVGFGRAILAPVTGTVVAVHDGEPDHVGRRSQLALVPYALGQAARVRAGIDAIAGNHVVLAMGSSGPFVALVHLRRDSTRVTAGDVVSVGDQLAECGNSGNSTEPCVHVQVTDSLDWSSAKGLPMAFRSYRSRRTGAIVSRGMPQESEIIETL
ncbi:M23 family metallopeptidase [Microbacterium sp.]|uniref:M23 family metallopeptidase n=1 Tax=Microbacterium sp. TaxID=51671 RepID=UPI002E343162|nr:M23 family metallopeptidase [Microbacterium sp.]HEX5730156.1 M23 family metallopeptidase [Microbacterium sp.]